MTGADLSVQIGNLILNNPVMPASGTFSEPLAEFIHLNDLGALVTKSITLDVREGNSSPRLAETPAGLLNAIGIPSKGVQKFIAETLPFYAALTVPLIPSISADTGDDFARLASILEKQSVVRGLEVNISCPNLEDDGKSFAMDAEQTYRVIRKVRQATSLPVWAKLSPNTQSVVEVALAAQTAGADAVVVANTLLAMAIDVETRRPKLGNVTGGLSGPAIKPIILRMVYQVAKAVSIPIIGVGGIRSAQDALEYLMAGATAIQVGTYNFVNPRGMVDVIAGMQDYLQRHGCSSVREIIGAALSPLTGAEEKQKTAG